MEVTCEHCQAKFKIPDEKVPKGKSFALGCPKCKQKITVTAPAAASDASKALADGVSDGAHDATERPFEFLEEGAKTAVICEQDPEYRSKLRAAVEEMEYYVTEATSGRAVLKQMRFHIFDLVVINERFDTPDPDRNNILRHLERLPMVTRRNMFVALISDRFRTMDNMAAFHKSVNVVVNLDSLDECSKILQRAVKDNDDFYRVFKEGLKRAGRG